MNQLQLKVGQSVLLFGAGSMGQLLTQALAHAGAGELVVVDVDPAKLELALHHGATAAVLSREIDQRLAGRTGHRGFDVVVDVTGIPSVIESEFKYLAPTGTYLQFGVAPQNAKISISPFDIYHKDLRIIGSMAINHTYKPALEWMKAGRFDVGYLVSETLRLDDVPKLLESGKASNVMKVQVTFE
jgi:threonine dehydrogenase-like Zn-dependent dehydrogenase